MRSRTKQERGNAAWRRGIFVAVALTCVMVSRVQAQTMHHDEGFTEPLDTVHVASPETGVIHVLEVHEGQRVSEGDIICQLDSQVLNASLDAAREKLDSTGKINGAIATLENKEHLLTQMKSLLDRQHASEKEVKQAQLDFDLAKANLETVRDEMRVQEMEVKRIEAQVERRIVRAPIDGVILELPRRKGEAITASESQVATIVNLTQLRVRYFLTTSQALTLKLGDRRQVSFPDTDQQASAAVEFVAPVTDSNSGTVRVEFLVDNAQGQYRSGLRCVLRNSAIASSSKDFEIWPASSNSSSIRGQ